MRCKKVKAGRVTEYTKPAFPDRLHFDRAQQTHFINALISFSVPFISFTSLRNTGFPVLS